MARITQEQADIIFSLYSQYGSVWTVGKMIGRCGQSVHEFLVRRGIVNKMNVFKEEDIQRLRIDYREYVDSGRLSVLAKEMGRTRNFLARQARGLGLTNISGKKAPHVGVASSLRMKKYHQTHDHPRGMLGKNHTQLNRNKMSETHTKRWKKMTKTEREEVIENQLKGRLKKTGSLVPNNRENASWKAGWREIGEVKKYYRSAWEANYARYLEWLKGLGEIQSWLHEPDTFWFEGIKRGVRSYLPDFKVIEKDGSTKYCEVKGWMDPASKTKLKRMKKYYPKIKIDLIDTKRYKILKKQVSGIIPGWE